jgi:crotonobetainyl-CoA:carnitine CoA-transferase CaiB-like acyl-CoA transferase
MRLPLEGIRVLDLAALLPGHYATQLLGDMGADVIKIERTGFGDMARRLFPGTFEGVNRNKRSIAIDLKSEDGKRVFYKLVGTADGIIEEFRPGVAARLGIDYETCRKINPGVIYVSIGGYGQEGPYRDWGGHDINYVGVAGHLGVAPLTEDYMPEASLAPVSDFGAGMFAALAVLTGLRGRELNGVGQFVDCSMTDGMVSWMSTLLAQHFLNGYAAVMSARGQAHYGVFKTKDGKYITLGALEDAFWQNLCRVMGRPDWASDSRFENIVGRCEHRDEIQPHVAAFIGAQDQEEILRIFNAEDVPSAPLNTLEEMLSDPQLVHRELFFDMDHPVLGKLKQIAHPLQYRGTPAQYRLPPPLVGQHTDELLTALGYGASEVAVLKESGAVQSTVVP